jgi:hypothetical protein
VAGGEPAATIWFVNDAVDGVPTQHAAKIRRQRLWNAIMGELRIPDQIDVDEDHQASAGHGPAALAT